MTVEPIVIKSKQCEVFAEKDKMTKTGMRNIYASDAV